jgi:predicted N-acyltransferase
VRSRHWIADPRFAQALHGWCAEERAAVEAHRQALLRHGPFRGDAA